MNPNTILRNQEIKRLYWFEGDSIAAIARKYGLKPERVKEVVLG